MPCLYRLTTLQFCPWLIGTKRLCSRSLQKCTISLLELQPATLTFLTQIHIKLGILPPFTRLWSQENGFYWTAFMLGPEPFRIEFPGWWISIDWPVVYRETICTRSIYKLKFTDPALSWVSLEHQHLRSWHQRWLRPSGTHHPGDLTKASQAVG